ncbi:hypothetical protein [Cytophaga aurantiaca]|uniref:hypothetical protein n=1 Tax=Cytophaga aurantiaca TaxID=29530 RepID=UPI00036C0A71|nr:hypothetical protein [Cytophaga aurantiaca]
MKKDFTILDTIRLIVKNKKLFIVTGSSVLVLSIIVSFLLPVYYKSTCILYPFNPQAYDPRNVDVAATPYGSSFDGDRIMALAESREIQHYIIEKYNLLDRYDIDRSDVLADYKVREEFIGNLRVVENEFSAIEISLMDKNADTAAIIVNDMVARIDDMNKKPLVTLSTKIFESYEKIILAKYHGIDSIQTLLHAKEQDLHSDVISLELLNTISDLNKARKSLELVKGDFSTLNIIQPAESIAKKAFPKRLYIVAASVVISLFLTFLVLITKELYTLSVENESKN